MSATMERASFLAIVRNAFPKHAAKRLAHAADAPLATAKAWAAGRFVPSADTLLRMARENDALRAEIIRMLTTGEAADDRTVVGAHRDRHGAPRAAEGAVVSGKGGVVEAAEGA